MKIDAVRKYAMALEAVTEEPHHQSSSFRVRGRIFVTVPPPEEVIHVFVGEEDREVALVLHPDFLEKLHWGGKVVGLRVALAQARVAAVESLVSKAYEHAVHKGVSRKRR
ncbi:MAG TPA: hypothetical protein VMA74_15325 [Dyella sp.]|uniref:hypothetical protein n=1 Tax=Dyella sp. TaxID=1869338 RepID=UPI002C9F4855|nr:hypothetical protein [Dyella sp.]HUB91094.1 hypothetical protein [Dyella sp.]